MKNQSTQKCSKKKIRNSSSSLKTSLKGKNKRILWYTKIRYGIDSLSVAEQPIAAFDQQYPQWAKENQHDNNLVSKCVLLRY